MNYRHIWWLAFLLALAPIAGAVTDLMALQGSATYNGAAVNSGNLTVTIWNQASGGSKLYDSGSDFLGKIQNGYFDVMLGSGSAQLSLQYGGIYYMDLSVNGQDLTFNGSDRKMFQSSVGNVTGPSVSPGSISDQQLTGTFAKTRISVTGAWNESEIPSLTSSWSGTLSASRIVSANLLSVNESLSLSGYTAAMFISNDSALSIRIGNLEIGRAGIGSCGAGYVMIGTTLAGVTCVAINNGTGSESDPVYLAGIGNYTLASSVNKSYVDSQDNTKVASASVNKTYVDTKAGTGSCGAGQVATATTAGGVTCVGMNNGTGSESDPVYLAGIGNYTLSSSVNKTYLDSQDNLRVLSSSVNKTYVDTKAGAGSCGAGQAATATTTGGVICVSFNNGTLSSESDLVYLAGIGNYTLTSSVNKSYVDSQDNTKVASASVNKSYVDTKAGTGSCGVGQAATATTTGGVICVSFNNGTLSSESDLVYLAGIGNYTLASSVNKSYVDSQDSLKVASASVNKTYVDTKAGAGSCSAGQVATATTTGGVVCVGVNNGSLSSESDPVYLAGIGNYTLASSVNKSYVDSQDSLKVASASVNKTYVDTKASNTSRFLLIDADANFPNSIAQGSTMVYFFDDFLAGAVTGRYTLLGTQTVVVTDTNTWGDYNYATGAVAGNDAGFSLGGTTTTTSSIYNVTSIDRLESRFLLASTAARRTWFGAFRTPVTQVFNNFTDGVAFRYENLSAGGYWVAQNCKASTCYQVTTASLADTSFHTFRINPSPTSVTYYIDGNLVATINQNIPQTVLVSWIGLVTENNDASADNTRVDWVIMEALRQ